MPRITKKALSLLAALVLVIVGTGVAYAYWTADGTGEGSAATGTTGSLTIVQTSDVTDMRPGGSPQELSGTFDNPTANGPVFVTDVTASITGVDKALGAVAGVCDASNYDLVNAVMDVGQTIPTGTSQGSWGDPADVATIQFHDKTSNQDACQGATVTIGYVSS
jgi:hypothetical protein